MDTNSDLDQRTLKVASFNCRSVKNSASCVKDLCQISDIVLLQEHWLLPNDLNFLSSLDKEFLTYGTSPVDLGKGILCGRPYGGVAVLWHKSLGVNVSIVSDDDDRILAVRISNDVNCDLLLICVYLPVECTNNTQCVYMMVVIRILLNSNNATLWRNWIIRMYMASE